MTAHYQHNTRLLTAVLLCFGVVLSSQLISWCCICVLYGFHESITMESDLEY
jgi:hypothetical protein